MRMRHANVVRIHVARRDMPGSTNLDTPTYVATIHLNFDIRSDENNSKSRVYIAVE